MGLLKIAHVLGPVPSKRPFPKYSFQTFFEMYHLSWINADELDEIIKEDAEYKALVSTDDILTYKKVRMDEGLRRLNTIKNNDHDPDKVCWIIENNRKHKDDRKGMDAPEESGQPRRFTKAFIPHYALLQCFTHYIYDYNIHNIFDLEKAVDAHCSKFQILNVLYNECLTYNESLFVTDWVGLGRYEHADALFIQKDGDFARGYMYTEGVDWEEFGLTKADVGILF